MARHGKAGRGEGFMTDNQKAVEIADPKRKDVVGWVVALIRADPSPHRKITKELIAAETLCEWGSKKLMLALSEANDILGSEPPHVEFKVVEKDGVVVLDADGRLEAEEARIRRGRASIVRAARLGSTIKASELTDENKQRRHENALARALHLRNEFDRVNRRKWVSEPSEAKRIT